MKKLISIFLCIAVVLTCVTVISFATEPAPVYYIDSVNGDDANTGHSEDSAWKTINHDEWVFVPGTKVLFKRGGVYEMEVTLTVSGTKENPIVISSYGDETEEKPIFRTSAHNEVFDFIDCDYVTLSDVAITAPNGGGVWIRGLNKQSNGMVIENVDFYDMQNYDRHTRDPFGTGAADARAAILTNGLWGPDGLYNYTVNDLTIKNCSVENCANGFILWGIVKGNPAETHATVERTYNKNVYVEGCYFNNMYAEAIVLGVCDGARVTNCASFNTCLGGSEPLPDGGIEYFTASMWFWGSKNSVFEHTEIAGQKNYGDAMTVDFDADSNYCTYQYMYSHDNIRFMCNNAMGGRPQVGNTVRYCLSVNDNVGRSSMASGSGEVEFAFYNNTIVNGHEMHVVNVDSGIVANNIFTFKPGYYVYYNDRNLTAKTDFTNNCYYMAPNPPFDLLSINTRPEFTGDDMTDPDSFRLAKGSKLIGAGIERDDIEKMEYDFFGEKITSTNIGCYGGDGVDVKVDRYDIFDIIIDVYRFFGGLFQRLIDGELFG